MHAPGHHRAADRRLLARGGGNRRRLVAVAVASAVASQPPLLASVYLASSVGASRRRGLIHSRSDGSPLGPAEVLRRHLQHDGESAGGWGKAVHLLHVFLWLAVFQPLYPLLELVLRPFDLAAFYFYYPRANGAGLVVDSLARRRGLRGTKAQVFRLDWQRFELNVGERYPSPNPGRHKPSVRCNLPHVDLPQRNVRHWPWRQHRRLGRGDARARRADASSGRPGQFPQAEEARLSTSCAARGAPSRRAPE